MMKSSEDEERCLQRALWHLSRRDYGVEELRRKLLNRPPDKALPSEDVAEQVLERLLEMHLLDDVKFAQTLSEELARRGWSAYAISQELSSRGVKELPEAPPEDAVQIQRLLERKYRQKLGDERGRRLTIQALMRRGFRYSEVRAAIEESAEEEMDDGDIWEEEG